MPPQTIRPLIRDDYRGFARRSYGYDRVFTRLAKDESNLVRRRNGARIVAEQLEPVPELPAAFATEAEWERARRFVEDLRELRPWMGQECGDLYCHICGVDSVRVA